MDQAPNLPLPAADAAHSLAGFVEAANAGPLLWARWVDGQLQVCGGTSPSHPISSEVGRLFVQALRAHFGAAASAIAEREWRLDEQPRRLLPARTVRHAVACADAALSLLMAQSQLLQIEFSAVMLGWRFRRVAQALGLDAAALPLARRQALDQLLQAELRASGLPAQAEALADWLQARLTQGLH